MKCLRLSAVACVALCAGCGNSTVTADATEVSTLDEAVADIDPDGTVTDVPRDEAVSDVDQDTAVMDVPRDEAVGDADQDTAVTDVPRYDETTATDSVHTETVDVTDEATVSDLSQDLPGDSLVAADMAEPEDGLASDAESDIGTRDVPADPGCTSDCPEPDSDSDTIPDSLDNCLFVMNMNQRDIDHDGAGDACDCDIDDDTVFNNNPGCPFQEEPDNCPYAPNPDQDPAACENPENPDDNCPFEPNPMQEDSDLDGIGDDCDCDADEDGILNTGRDYDGNPCPYVENPDNCTLIANETQDDLDQDGIGDACDCDIDGDGDPQPNYGCPTPLVPDCGPLEKLVSHLATEICSNSIDDDCNGATDEVGCELP